MSNKKKLLIWAGGNAFEVFDERSYEVGLSEKEPGQGGSESWIIEMVPRFVKAGYEVHVFNVCSDPIRKDTRCEDAYWHHFSLIGQFLEKNKVDVLVAFRQSYIGPKHICDVIPAEKTFMLAEDTLLNLNPNLDVWDERINAVIALCPYHKTFLANHHKIPADRIWIGKNGVDLDLYERAKKEVVKKPYKFFYSSSLDRGVDNLLQFMWPHIKREFPEAELGIYYGFNNWRKAIQIDSDRSQVPDATEMHIRWVEQLMEANKSQGVTFHGRVGKWTLAKAQAECSMHLYPTFFSETFCSTYLEAMAADAVTVSTNIWAGARTGKAGFMINVDQGDNHMMNFYLSAYSSKYQQTFVDSVITLLKDPKKMEKVLTRQRAWVQNFTWDKSAQEYLNLFDGKYQDPQTKKVIEPGFDL